MSQFNIVILAEIFQFDRFEGLGIISHQLLWTTESGQDIFQEKLDYDRISGISGRYGFDPFCKIIRGYKDPLVLP